MAGRPGGLGDKGAPVFVVGKKTEADNDVKLLVCYRKGGQITGQETTPSSRYEIPHLAVCLVTAAENGQPLTGVQQVPAVLAMPAADIEHTGPRPRGKQ